LKVDLNNCQNDLYLIFIFFILQKTGSIKISFSADRTVLYDFQIAVMPAKAAMTDESV